MLSLSKAPAILTCMPQQKHYEQLKHYLSPCYVLVCTRQQDLAEAHQLAGFSLNFKIQSMLDRLSCNASGCKPACWSKLIKAACPWVSTTSAFSWQGCCSLLMMAACKRVRKDRLCQANAERSQHSICFASVQCTFCCMTRIRSSQALLSRSACRQR